MIGPFGAIKKVLGGVHNTAKKGTGAVAGVFGRGGGSGDKQVTARERTLDGLLSEPSEAPKPDGVMAPEPGMLQLNQATPEYTAMGKANQQLAYKQQQGQHAAGQGQSPLGWGIEPDAMGGDPGISVPYTAEDAAKASGGLSPDVMAGVAGMPSQPDMSGTDPANMKPSGMAAPVDQSGWDIDNYAAPKKTVAGAGPAPAGYDPEKWASGTHQTPKYAVSRILSGFDLKGGMTPEIAAAVAEAYPGTEPVGRDKLKIPGVGTIDVIGGSANNEGRLQWIDLDHEAKQGGAGGGMGASPTDWEALLGGGGMPQGDQNMDTSAIIQAILRGEQPKTATRARVLGDML